MKTLDEHYDGFKNYDKHMGIFNRKPLATNVSLIKTSQLIY